MKQQEAFNEARHLLEQFVTGKWWKKYAALVQDSHGMVEPMWFPIGRSKNEAVHVRVIDIEVPTMVGAYLLFARRHQMTAHDALRGVYGPRGEHLELSPLKLIVRLYLEVQKRVALARTRAGNEGNTELLEEFLSFEREWFPVFSKQIAHAQSRDTWLPGGRFARFLLKLRVVGW